MCYCFCGLLAMDDSFLFVFHSKAKVHGLLSLRRVTGTCQCLQALLQLCFCSNSPSRASNDAIYLSFEGVMTGRLVSLVAVVGNGMRGPPFGFHCGEPAGRCRWSQIEARAGDEKLKRVF